MNIGEVQDGSVLVLKPKTSIDSEHSKHFEEGFLS